MVTSGGGTIVLYTIGGTTKERTSMTTTNGSAAVGRGSGISIAINNAQIVGLKNTVSQHRAFSHTGSFFKSREFNGHLFVGQAETKLLAEHGLLSISGHILLQFVEPRSADPHATWCGEGRQ